MEILQVLEQIYGKVEGFEYDDYLFAHGSPRCVILYSPLFMPELVEIGDLILLKLQLSTESLARIPKSTNLTLEERRKIEEEYNWLELPYIFADRETNDEELELLANRLCESWRAWLHYKYPTRQFSVGVIGSEETGGALGVGFYQT